MKKLNIKQSFRTKKFKYGGFSALLTIIVFAALLAINYAAGKYNVKKDLTQEKIYSITSETKNLTNNLKNNINIIAFYETGKEDPGIKAVLEQYKASSKKIEVDFKDPSKYPAIVEKYTKGDVKPSIGSLVVECGNKFKVISSDELFNQTTDDSGNSQISSFAAEQQLTNAIVFVTSGKEQNLYVLTGHEEAGFTADLQKQLGTENYVVKDVNLLQGSSVLNKDDILAVVAPKKDISKDELEKIKAFLADGGKAAFFMDITKEKLPNFQSLLAIYGIQMQNAVVVEGQAENAANTPIYLLPNMEDHDIVNALKSNKLPVLMPLAQGINIEKSKKDSTTVEPILTTSKNSWGKVNLNATTFSKENGDLQGPFNIAAAITDIDKVSNKTTKLVVVGSASFMNADAVSATNGTNMDFAINSLNWLQDKKDTISIRPKDLTAPTLMLNSFQKLALSGLVVIVIPAIIMITGIIVWIKRRHR